MPEIITMSMNLYPLIRPFLFALDAEKAHELMLDWLHRTQSHPFLRKLYSQPKIYDPVELAGLRFPNRVGLAAGLDKNAACIDGLAAMGFGFIEVGTVTPLAQPGNDRPRMFRIPEASAVINRMGFNNHGVQAFVENVRKSHIRQDSNPLNRVLLGLNIGKNAATPIENAASDYVACLEAVYPYADYVTINISSPNTKNLRALQSDEALDALLHAISDARKALNATHPNKPIFLKIAPDLDQEQVLVIAATLQRHAIDGVIASNTTINHERVQSFPHGKEQGGVSGAPVREASNQVIRTLREKLGPNYPIIGVGGILDEEDALEKIEAGADVVQIYSGLIYRGPVLVTQIARALQKAKQS